MHLPRLFSWILASLLLLIIVALLAPQQLPVSLYKLSLISTAAVAGYWLDRSLFPYARPGDYLEEVIEPDEDSIPPQIKNGDSLALRAHSIPPQIKNEDSLALRAHSIIPFEDGSSDHAQLLAAAMIRRAIIVGCAMLAISLGA